LRNPISGKLRLHSNSKRKRNSNVHFFHVFGLISQIGHRSGHATNSVIATARETTAFYVVTQQRSGLTSKWCELI